MSVAPQAAAVDNTRADPADCEELMARNDKSREDLNTEKAESTISHGQYTNGDSRENLWSRSKGEVHPKLGHLFREVILELRWPHGKAKKEKQTLHG